MNLNSDQQAAVNGMMSRFIKAVRKSGTFDGSDFARKYSVQSSGAEFVITDGVTPLAGIRHRDPIVMHALMTEAVGNHNR